jgi:hypothetical protein
VLSASLCQPDATLCSLIPQKRNPAKGLHAFVSDVVCPI